MNSIATVMFFYHFNVVSNSKVIPISNVSLNMSPHLIHFKTEGYGSYSFKQSNLEDLQKHVHYLWHEVTSVYSSYNTTTFSIEHIFSRMFKKIKSIHLTCNIGSIIRHGIRKGQLRRTVISSTSPCNHLHLQQHLDKPFAWKISVHTHFMIKLHVHSAYIHYSDECKVTSFLVSEPNYGNIQQFCGHSWNRLVYMKSHIGVLEITGESSGFVTFDISYDVLTKGFAALFDGANLTVPGGIQLDFLYTPEVVYYEYDHYYYYWYFYHPASFHIPDPFESDDDMTLSEVNIKLYMFSCYEATSLQVHKGLHLHMQNISTSPLCALSCPPALTSMQCSVSEHKYITLMLKHHIFESQLKLGLNFATISTPMAISKIELKDTEKQYQGKGSLYHISHMYFTHVRRTDYENFLTDKTVSLTVNRLHYFGHKMNMMASEIYSLPRISSLASEDPRGM